jgi:hypothetical protein
MDRDEVQSGLAASTTLGQHIVFDVVVVSNEYYVLLSLFLSFFCLSSVKDMLMNQFFVVQLK